MFNVIVEFKMPKKMDIERVAKNVGEGPEFYLDAPGLITKSWVVSEDGMTLGGIYLWKDKKSAMDWYEGTGKARLEAIGVEPKMTFFESFALTDVEKQTVTREETFESA